MTPVSSAVDSDAGALELKTDRRALGLALVIRREVSNLVISGGKPIPRVLQDRRVRVIDN